MNSLSLRIDIKALTLVALLIPNVALAAEISAKYLKNTDNSLHRFEQLLQSPQGLPVMLSFVNDIILLDRPLTVLVGAEDGPLYDPEAEEIFLPLTFLQEIEARFANAFDDMQPQDLDNAVLDVVMHTLFHELGHALVAQYELPVLAKEEDAVDSLANMLLLDYVEDGDLIAFSAADMFSLEDEDVEQFDHQDFWDEHSLDIQRYYTTLCHIYGSDPDKHKELVDDGTLSAERGELCLYEYEQIRNGWISVLADYMK